MRILVILSIILCWIFGLINDSGWGISFSTDEKMNWIIFLWAMYLFISKKRKILPTLNIEYIIALILFFIIIPFFISKEWEGGLYFFSFLTIYCFSNISITKKELAITAYLIGLLGLCLITIYLRTEILSGWNDNGIAMLTLFSFIYFTTYFNSIKSKWQKYIYWCIAILYIVQISRTDSRGAILFMSASLYMVIAKQTTIKYLSKSIFRFIIIHIPLIIALVTIYIAAQSWFTNLDTWYQLNHAKPLFNGREVLWTETLKNIFQYPLGTGKFIINYHNSAIACIGVFGILGYFLWSKFFIKLLNYMIPYFKDSMVYAFTCAFLVIFIQQSTELGFIKPTPNMLPYMILGLGIGRIRWYKRKKYTYGKS